MTNLNTNDLTKLNDLLTALNDAKIKKAEKDVITMKLMAWFRETGLKSYKTKEGLEIRFVDERTTSQFDAETLQQKYPDIWQECHVTKTRPAHISYKQTTPKKNDEVDDE